MDAAGPSSDVAPRRSVRPSRSTHKYSEFKQSRRARHQSSSEEEEWSSFEELEEPDKPTILHAHETVHGEKMFSFPKRKSRMAVIQKAEQTLPQQREYLKKGIARKVLEGDSGSSGQDFSDSGSEYVGSDQTSESSTEEEEEEEHSEEDDDEEEEAKVKPSKKSQTPASKGAPKRSKKDYVINTDNYFSNHHSKKIITSNHTLDKLETPRLAQDKLQKLLSHLKLSSEHKKGLRELEASNKLNFGKWMYLLHENFNVILHGLGSKKVIIEQFQAECLKKRMVVVINGFFPSLTIKDILDGIIVDLLELKDNPADVYEACDLIEQVLEFLNDQHLYLIVHNIENVRNSKAQNVFARLAALKNVHLIASVDHINAPLIWDHAKLSKFNFTWWDVTSFQPYIDETSFENSMLVQGSGVLALSSLQNVFLSLTSNSKRIYLTLVKYQLDNHKTQYYQGLPFKDLYSSCREAFLVSSDLALRTQLTEFLDHKMVKFKRSADGTEHIVIPISNVLLQQFLSEQEAL